tara:strand:+ start:395 stop:850 length:456 start_codon:yes stop_codon:yes gene_type:complete
MRKLDSSDLKDLALLKHYRIIRKWVCKTCNIKEADLELLMYLDSLNLFTKQDFKTGTYSYSWDNRRWNRLLKEEWIVVWRVRNRTTQKYHIYKTSQRFKHLLSRIYRIMLGEEDIPTTESANHIMKGKTYMDKVLIRSIKNLNADKNRGNG